MGEDGPIIAYKVERVIEAHARPDGQQAVVLFKCEHGSELALEISALCLIELETKLKHIREYQLRSLGDH